MFSLASLTKPAICSSTTVFSNGITNIVCAIIMFPIPVTYVSNIYANREISSFSVLVAVLLAVCWTIVNLQSLRQNVCNKGEFVWAVIPLGPSQVSTLCYSYISNSVDIIFIISGLEMVYDFEKKLSLSLLSIESWSRSKEGSGGQQMSLKLFNKVFQKMHTLKTAQKA